MIIKRYISRQLRGKICMSDCGMNCHFRSHMREVATEFIQTSPCLHLSLIGLLLGRNRLSHTVGVLGQFLISAVKVLWLAERVSCGGSYSGHPCKAQINDRWWYMAFFFCLRGRETRILVFVLPNFNLFSIYKKRIHPLDRFKCSLKENINLGQTFFFSSGIFSNAWTRLKHFCYDRPT